MKCAVVFLVLSMVVLMAEPGECILGMLFHGAVHCKVMESMRFFNDQLEKLDKRSVNYNPAQPRFI
uniref:Piscidin-2 n=1 Tax=Seriola dumerili TaxID=41447 RepID=A0A3B4TMN0_SERDU